MTMQKKMTNKRLVKHLMDTKGVASITVLPDVVCVEFKPTFTPTLAENLVKEVGHDDFKAATKGGHNYIVFKRW